MRSPCLSAHGHFPAVDFQRHLARVSSESDEQLNSLGNQVSYYEEFIRKNSAWEYVPGYVDEGLSAATTKKREDFHRMVEDGKAVQRHLLCSGADYQLFVKFRRYPDVEATLIGFLGFRSLRRTQLLHRPHPRKELLAYQVKQLMEILEQEGLL